jgi:UDP-N-acetylmuramoyl-tripeptide--D-alanyl-D-alanine ligase
MQLNLGEIAAALGSVSARPEVLVDGYSIDSRTVKPASLFFAIRGPRFDGHDFVSAALASGAVAAVVERTRSQEMGASARGALVEVEDTTGALQQLGHFVRRRWGRKVIGVTGSTGKSTTKELIAAVLNRKLTVHKSPGNLNNHFGVPLALVALEPAHQVAVLEMAMSGPGEIAHLARISEPEIGVVTNVAAAHLQYFESVDAIARAKRELIEHLPAAGVAVLNADDPHVRHFGDGFAGQVVTFGFSDAADVRARMTQPEPSIENEPGASFEIEGMYNQERFWMPLPGRHNVENALAALVVAGVLGISAEDVRSGLREFRPLRQRSEILHLKDGITIINDCYNSNPRAMERMLELLGAWPGAKRKIVIAGEMLELGPTSPALHRQVGAECAQAKVDCLIAVQGDAHFILEGAIEAGIPPDCTRWFQTAVDAAEFCRDLLRMEDVVLIKGSRAVHLEKVTEALVQTASLAGASVLP